MIFRVISLGVLLALGLPATPLPAEDPLTSDHEEEIRAALEMYRQALEAKDLGALRQVRPSLSLADLQRLQRAFDKIESLEVVLTVDSITARGDRAEVKGVREDTVVTKDGRTMHNQGKFVYTLQATSGGWVLMATE